MVDRAVQIVLRAGFCGLALIALAGCETTGVVERSAEQLNNPQPDPRNNIASLTSILTQNPRDANALNLRGTAYGQQSEYEKALSDFSAAIQVNSQFYQA